MMDAILLLFGQGRTLDPLQMAMRAIVVFLIALVLIRISGRRSFGQRSPFDSVVVILLGATLSRAIVGASPFIATVVASFMIVACHRLLAWACMRSRGLERLVGGVEREVFSNGAFNTRELDAALITPNRRARKRAAENRLTFDGRRGRGDSRTQRRSERDPQEGLRRPLSPGRRARFPRPRGAACAA